MTGQLRTAGSVERFITLNDPVTIYLALWAAAMVFLVRVRRRRHFVRAAVLGLALALAAGVLQSRFQPFWGIQLVGIAACMVLFFWACGDLTLPQALYGGIWAMVCQQLTYETWWVLYELASRRLALGGWYVLGAVLYYAAVDLTLCATVCRWLPEHGVYKVGPRQVSSAVVLMAIFQICFWYLIRHDLPGNTLGLAAVLPAQFYCAAMLFFQNALFRKSDMRHELDLLNRMWYEQKQQYDLAKENIDLINRKCHDLKHQIAAMRATLTPENQEKYLTEIEHSIRIYDAVVKTGNEVLDTLLTEKSLLCEAKQITINCVADGSRLRFIDPVDLYTILGNAVDNAIEEVQKFTDAEKRLIDVLICTEREFLVIQIANPMQGELQMGADGLPRTTKEGNGYHGFGLKSIRHTVAKYGGHTNLHTENGRFALKLLIPLPEEAVQ